MGSTQSRDKNKAVGKDIKVMRKKVNHLEKEISEIMFMRKSESQAYERQMMDYTLKEGEWKRERKRMREEVKKLRKKVEKREKKIRGMELDEMVGEKNQIVEDEWESYWQMVVEEEMRKRQDEAAERWKKLYLAIKIELDDLVQRTYQGEKLCWKAEEEEEEDLVEELRKELKAQEEKIGILQARLASMDREKSKREREVDILRQSLRIMSHNYSKKKPSTGNGDEAKGPHMDEAKFPV